MVGGFNGTSNVIAGLDFDVLISGTMAHSFIQSYGDELQAFREATQPAFDSWAEQVGAELVQTFQDAISASN